MDIVTNTGGMPFWLFDPQTLVILLNYLVIAVIVVTLLGLAYAALYALLSNNRRIEDRSTGAIHQSEVIHET